MILAINFADCNKSNHHHLDVRSNVKNAGVGVPRTGRWPSLRGRVLSAEFGVYASVGPCGVNELLCAGSATCIRSKLPVSSLHTLRIAKRHEGLTRREFGAFRFRSSVLAFRSRRPRLDMRRSRIPAQGVVAYGPCQGTRVQERGFDFRASRFDA